MEAVQATSCRSIDVDSACEETPHGIKAFESGSNVEHNNSFKYESIDCSTQLNKSTFGFESDFSDGWTVPQPSCAHDEDDQDGSRIPIERISEITTKGNAMAFQSRPNSASQSPTLMLLESDASTSVTPSSMQGEQATKMGGRKEVVGHGGDSAVISEAYPAAVFHQRKKNVATSHAVDLGAYENELKNGRERMRMDASSYEAFDVDPIEEDAVLFENEFTTMLFRNVKLSKKRFDEQIIKPFVFKSKRTFRSHRASILRIEDKKKLQQDSLRFDEMKMSISMKSIEDLRMDANSNLARDVRTRCRRLETKWKKRVDGDKSSSEDDESQSPVQAPCKPTVPPSRREGQSAGSGRGAHWHVRPHLLTSTFASSP